MNLDDRIAFIICYGEYIVQKWRHFWNEYSYLWGLQVKDKGQNKIANKNIFTCLFSGISFIYALVYNIKVTMYTYCVTAPAYVLLGPARLGC